MEFQTISVNALVANDYNPNEMTDEEFQECKREITHLGTLPKPVVVRPKDSVYVIVDGEHNWRAAKELGFTTVPCEVLKLDDVEAMRQSYKRNMHGKFNPVKLGKMFERALEQTSLSQRVLADQYEISEGTVRNALAYSEAARLRNSYAFEKLPVRQLRLYLTLPPIIRDKWLDAGADSKLLIPGEDLRKWENLTGKRWGESSFDDMEKDVKNYTQNADASYLHRFNHIYEVGLADMIKPTRTEFCKSIERALEFARWEYWTFHHGNPDLGAKVREYTKHYYEVDVKSIRDEFHKLYRLICFKGEFRVTPEEFEKIVRDSKVAGCEPGYSYKYPQYDYMQKAIQVLLIEKGILDDQVDVNALPDPGEKLLQHKLEKNGPNYIKQAYLPLRLKGIIFEYKPHRASLDTETLETAKRETVAFFENRYKSNDSNYFKYIAPSEEEVEEKINSRIAQILDKRKVANMSNEDIATKVISFTRLYKGESESEQLNEFTANLLRLKREELLAIYYIMNYMNFVKDMRKMVKSFGKR